MLFNTHQIEKRLTTPNVDEGVEQLRLSYIASGVAKWYKHFEKLLGFHYKIKLAPTLWFNISSSRSLSKRIKACVQNDLCKVSTASLI